MEKERSAGAVIFRKNKETKYLLLHYELGHWGFPKGNIEAKEKNEDTIKREAEEETGLKDITIIKNFKEKLHYFYMSEISTRKLHALAGNKREISEHAQKPAVFDKLKGQLTSKEVVFYLAETKKAKIKLSFEHIGYKWLPFKEALEKLSFKNSKDILKKADDFLKRNPRLSDYFSRNSS